MWGFVDLGRRMRDEEAKESFVIPLLTTKGEQLLVRQRFTKGESTNFRAINGVLSLIIVGYMQL
jgi:hypothetical protein